MSEIDDLLSLEAETQEDQLSGEFCECGHLIKDHFCGEFSKFTKCFALIFNGTVWSSCKCDNLYIKPFEIRFKVECDAESLQNAA